MTEAPNKMDIRRHLREVLAGMTDAQRRAKSAAATSLLTGSPEFAAARVVMLYLSIPQELETAALALRC